VGGGVVVRGVADGTLVDGQVGVEEEADVARLVVEVADGHPAEEDRLVEVHGVVAGDLEPEPLVDQADVGHQGVGLVAEFTRPPLVLDPGELAVGPDAEALDVPGGVVVLAHTREVEIAHPVEVVEGDEQVAVADGDIAGHAHSLRSSSGNSRAWERAREGYRPSAGGEPPRSRIRAAFFGA
jgi:hypothetical protein